MKNATPLPRLNAKLLELYGQAPTGGYRRLYGMAVDGILPVQHVGGRIFVRDIDLPAVAEMLGLRSATTRTAA